MRKAQDLLAAGLYPGHASLGAVLVLSFSMPATPPDPLRVLENLRASLADLRALVEVHPDVIAYAETARLTEAAVERLEQQARA